MGKEAIVHYQQATESGQAKAVLESNELILRIPATNTRKTVTRKLSIASITRVQVEGDQLHLRIEPEKSELTLTFDQDQGPSEAQSWAKKLTMPPPTLAAKLGINSETKLQLIGEFATEELATAIQQAASIEASHPNLVLARVETMRDLDYALDQYKAYPGNPPIWIIYPKGVKKAGALSTALGETAVRDTLRREGFVDIKIASVSPALTALRFIKRAN